MPALRDRTALLLPPSTTPLAITAAVTNVVSDELGLPSNVASVEVQANFVYGSGGTTAKVWLQTSLDGGVTWIDVASLAFTTASGRRGQVVNAYIAAAANITFTDGTLADNTKVDGLLGDRIRVKLTTTGTYAGGTTLRVTANVLVAS